VIPRWFNEDDNRITVLVLAWAYILSARWAEVIPGASGPEYSDRQAEWDNSSIPSKTGPSDSNTVVISIGGINDDAARWWAAALALEGN
jgi:hypothetical protein